MKEWTITAKTAYGGGRHHAAGSPREIIEGEVIYVTDSEVMVNINYKSDGIIKQDELSENTNAKPKDLFTPGQTIEVYVIKLDDGEGNVILSSRRVEKYKNWQKLMDIHEAGETVEATIEKDVKGGLLVTTMGINGFIPGSHVDTHYVRDLSAFVGQTVEAKIISIDERKRRLVLSRKVVIEAEKERILDEAWEKIHVGDVVTGKVARLTDFGAFLISAVSTDCCTFRYRKRLSILRCAYCRRRNQ